MAFQAEEVAIVTVHGNGPEYKGRLARRYPWPRLQLEQLRRHTPPGYKVLAYGNDLIPNHEAILRGFPEVELYLSSDPMMRPLGRRPWPARNLLAHRAHRRFRHIVILDSDAFPVADDWLARYVGLLDERRPLVAVQRAENGDDFSHVSFMVFAAEAWRRHRFDFSPLGVRDAGGAVSAELETEGFGWHPLLRSNRWNPHPLTAGIYDERIYHHAAGTRLPQYRINRQEQRDPQAWQRELELHRGLLDVLFDDPQGLADRLLGRREPMPEDELRARAHRAADA